ncbi:MAG: cyclodeaminase/cyclohydrolase family protein [Thermoplasmata archaeon]|nr:cyclodeaminase/cyclohydrolase family protein [Thermoplasmata archaeon]
MGVDLEDSVNAFLEDLASSQPTPGGGSAAALVGSLGAALGSMVCRLTVGKKGYEEVEEAFRGYARELRLPRDRLRALVQEDAEAFQAVMAAFRLNKGTNAAKKRRSAAIQSALKEAAEVPLETAGHCVEVLRLLRVMADGANKNAVSDVGVGAHLALAALKSAFLNVDINLGSIDDEAFVTNMRSKVEELGRQALADHEATLAVVERRLV